MPGDYMNVGQHVVQIDANKAIEPGKKGSLSAEDLKLPHVEAAVNFARTLVKTSSPEAKAEVARSKG